ncbi:unnamed protein product, partial [Laminaria digitata]
QSVSAQSVAVGNLGTLAIRRGKDKQTAAACLEQYLQLVQQLGDWQGEITAWSKMAQLAAAEGSQPTEAVAGGGESRGGSAAFDAVNGVVDGFGQHDEPGRGGDGLLSGGGGGPDAAAVARSLSCFERAAALAKSHMEVSTLKRLHCDMGLVQGNATMEDYFRSLQ